MCVCVHNRIAKEAEAEVSRRRRMNARRNVCAIHFNGEHAKRRHVERVHSHRHRNECMTHMCSNNVHKCVYNTTVFPSNAAGKSPGKRNREASRQCWVGRSLLYCSVQPSPAIPLAHRCLPCLSDTAILSDALCAATFERSSTKGTLQKRFIYGV